MNGDVPLDEGFSVDDRIDERCDAFESAWRNGIVVVVSAGNYEMNACHISPSNSPKAAQSSLGRKLFADRSSR